MGDIMNGGGGVHVEDSPFPLTDTDRWVLSQTDEEFHLHDWDELKEIIGMLYFIFHGKSFTYQGSTCCTSVT
jgi:hypothetical protein